MQAFPPNFFVVFVIFVLKALLVKRLLVAGIALLVSVSVLAQAPDRTARTDRLLQTYVDEGRIAGAVVLVLRDGKPVYEKAFGWADKEAGRKMTTDTIFRIASQTKAITSAAIMSLVEEGKVAINDPVEPLHSRVREDDGGGGGRRDVKIVPARRAITIRDLLTHTAGISYGTNPSVAAQYKSKGSGPAAGFGWYTADKDEPICTTMETLATLPFVASPANRGSTATTPTSSAASSNARLACRSTSSSGRGSRRRWA